MNKKGSAEASVPADKRVGLMPCADLLVKVTAARDVPLFLALGDWSVLGVADLLERHKEHIMTSHESFILKGIIIRA